MSRRTKNYS